MKTVSKTIIDLLINKFNIEGLGENKFIDFVYSHESKDGFIIKDRNNTHYLCDIRELEPKELAKMELYDNMKLWKKEYGSKSLDELKKSLKRFRKDTELYLVISELIKNKESKN